MHTHNNYSTPSDLPRHVFDRLALNTRLYFQTRFVHLALSSRREALEGHYDTSRWVATSLEVFRLIEQCGGRFDIRGLDNLRITPGPAVILSNHMSVLETMVFPGIIQPLRDITFVVKDALVSHRIFGPVMRSRNPIVLHRSNPREDLKIVLEQGAQKLSQGISVIIFPQSTRKKTFVPEEFNSIGTKLAARTGVPVIPAAIKTDFWKTGKFAGYLGAIDRKQIIHMEFGDPVPVKGTGREEHQAVIDFIQERLKRWQPS